MPKPVNLSKDWDIVQLTTITHFNHYQAWIKAGITSYYDTLKDPNEPQSIDEMVNNIRDCCPWVWLIVERNNWVGMGCLVSEGEGQKPSYHGLMRPNPLTGNPIQHPGKRALIRLIIQTRNKN